MGFKEVNGWREIGDGPVCEVGEEQRGLPTVTEVENDRGWNRFCVRDKNFFRGQGAHGVASQIRAGRVVINGMTDDPRAPWGGFKYSGFGREYGQYGIEAFLEARAILE
jgi:Aldehyde dehydrogenase family